MPIARLRDHPDLVFHRCRSCGYWIRKEVLRQLGDATRPKSLVEEILDVLPDSFEL
jgi:hypothetical protein